MSVALMAAILFGVMFILLVIGAEVFVAMGISAALGLLVFCQQPLEQFAFTAFDTMNSFVLTALPLFIFMGAMLGRIGIVRSLFDAAEKWIGALPGGIACSVIAVNAAFGALSGSTLAATATFGKIAYPDMKRVGYDPKLALGSLAVAGVLSAAIPPSLTLIIYGALANVSVPRLFAAVLLPGIILTILLGITVIVQVKLNPGLAPKPTVHTWSERINCVKDLLPWLALIGSVLGTIFLGIMTPTESASMGAMFTCILAIVYRKMSFEILLDSMKTAIRIMGMCSLILVSARVLGQVYQHIGITDLFSDFMLGMSLGKYGTIAVIYLTYIILGMFIDDWSLMLITIPIILPTIIGLGFSPVWFGVFFIMVESVALLTPPFGLHLFVLKAVIPEHKVMTIALGVIPFFIPLVLMAVLLVAFPEIALWLPSLLY